MLQPRTTLIKSKKLTAAVPTRTAVEPICNHARASCPRLTTQISTSAVSSSHGSTQVTKTLRLEMQTPCSLPMLSARHRRACMTTAQQYRRRHSTSNRRPIKCIRAPSTSSSQSKWPAEPPTSSHKWSRYQHSHQRKARAEGATPRAATKPLQTRRQPLA